MFVGHPPPTWDVLTMAVAPHTGIPRCTLLDARAGGIGNTMSTHVSFPAWQSPCQDPPETLCGRIEKPYRPGWPTRLSVPGERGPCSSTSVFQDLFPPEKADCRRPETEPWPGQDEPEVGWVHLDGCFLPSQRRRSTSALSFPPSRTSSLKGALKTLQSTQAFSLKCRYRCHKRSPSPLLLLDF